MHGAIGMAKCLRLYFVRHGESEGNMMKVHQRPDVKLTALGQKQARTVALRLKGIPVDAIVCSTLTRAKQTAIAISSTNKKKVVYTHLLDELKRPTEILGKGGEDKETVRYFAMMHMHMGERGWHYSDEENWYDLEARAGNALDRILAMRKEKILVIAHGGMIKAIVLELMLRNGGRLPEWERKGVVPYLLHDIDGFLKLENTGITVCESKDGKFWRLITWNDFAHLEN